MKLKTLGTLFTVVRKIVTVGFKIVEAVSHTPIPELVLVFGCVSAGMSTYRAYNIDVDKEEEVEEFEPGKFRMLWSKPKDTPGKPIIDDIVNFKFRSAVNKLRNLYESEDDVAYLAYTEVISFCCFSAYGLLLTVRTISNVNRMRALRFSATRLAEYCEFVDSNSKYVISQFDSNREGLSQPYGLELYNFAKSLNSVYHGERPI